MLFISFSFFFVIIAAMGAVSAHDDCPDNLRTEYGCTEGAIILRPLLGEIVHSTTVEIQVAAHSSMKASTLTILVDDIPRSRFPSRHARGMLVDLAPGTHTAYVRMMSGANSDNNNDESGSAVVYETEKVKFFVVDDNSSSSSSSGSSSSGKNGGDGEGGGGLNDSHHHNGDEWKVGTFEDKNAVDNNFGAATTRHSSHSGKSRFAVFGAEHNLRKGELRAFAGSFRATGSTADLIMWTTGIRPELEEIADTYGMQLIEYDFWLLNRTYGPVGDHRFHLFREFLEQGDNLAKYAGGILVTDVRDVMFQLDPFENIPYGRGVASFQEAIHMPIHASWTNRHWLTDNCTVYKNEKLLERIQHNPRSCSGVTIGTGEGMYRYIKTMEEELQRTCDAEFDPSDGKVTARGWCADQAVHQCVFYTGMLEAQGVEVTLHSNEYGPLLTIGDVLFYNVSGDGDVINWNGEVVSMVHQYDRHQPLREQLQNMYWDEEERNEYRRRYPKYRGHGAATVEEEREWEEKEERRKKGEVVPEE